MARIIILLASCFVLVLQPIISNAQFTNFNVHPYAPNYPCNSGKVINDIKAYNGALFTGYGNYCNQATTFPTRICRITPPGVQSVCEHSIQSSVAYHYRVLDGSLYALGGDSHPVGGHNYARRSGVVWQNQASITTNIAHIYDMDALGSYLFLTLTKFSDNARVMRRNSDGTWVEKLKLIPIGTNTSQNYTAILFVAAYQGKLYTQGIDTIDGPHPTSKVSTNYGNTWTNGPSMIKKWLVGSSWVNDVDVNDYKHVVISNKLVMLQVKSLVQFDGALASVLMDNVEDFTKYSTGLYVLRESGEVEYSTDLSTWWTLAQAPNNAKSIEVLDGDIYVGTSDGKVYDFGANSVGSTPHDINVTYELLLN